MPMPLDDFLERQADPVEEAYECPVCLGSGFEPDSNQFICWKCHGDGYLTASQLVKLRTETRNERMEEDEH